MAQTQFYLDRPKGDAPTRIVLSVHWNGRRLKYPTGCSVVPRHWREDKQRATGHAPTCKACTHPAVREVDMDGTPLDIVAHKEINTRLELLKGWALDILDRFNKEHKRTPEREELLHAMKERDGRAESDGPTDLLSFIARFIEKSADRKNERTLPVHSTWHGRNRIALRLLREYVKGKPLPFTSVDAEFVAGFLNFLTVTKDYSTNTVGKYMRALRMFVNGAVNKGHELPRNVLGRGALKVPEDKDVFTVYLNEAEINDLFHLDLSAHPRLDRARDLFIVGCETGLRFGDLSRLRAEHVFQVSVRERRLQQVGGRMVEEVEERTEERIRIQASKTGKEVAIHMRPLVRAIFDKYGGQFPPAISNQRMNDYVKEVAQLVPSLQARMLVSGVKGGVKQEVVCAKWEMVTTHTARRSFASNRYREGLPSRTIMAITGHRTEGAFMRYIRLTNEEHADMMAQHERKARPMLKAV